MADTNRSVATGEFSWDKVGEDIAHNQELLRELWGNLHKLHKHVDAHDDSPAVRHLDSAARAAERSLVALTQAQTVQSLRAAHRN